MDKEKKMGFRLKVINHTVLKEMMQDSDRNPTVYIHPLFLVRWLFWSRFATITKLLPQDSNLKVLDFGGGGGVYLPTLAEYYKDVTCVDIEASNARIVKDRFKLDNVKIIEGDAFQLGSEAKWDLIIAADVIEHFQDLEKVCKLLKSLLRSEGVLIISAPSETRFYELGRKIFGFTKPIDHYHNSNEIVSNLRKYFTLLDIKPIPKIIGTILPAFTIGKFQYQEKSK